MSTTKKIDTPKQAILKAMMSMTFSKKDTIVIPSLIADDGTTFYGMSGVKIPKKILRTSGHARMDIQWECARNILRIAKTNNTRNLAEHEKAKKRIETDNPDTIVMQCYIRTPNSK